jgi:hypothetical protein
MAKMRTIEDHEIQDVKIWRSFCPHCDKVTGIWKFVAFDSQNQNFIFKEKTTGLIMTKKGPELFTPQFSGFLILLDGGINDSDKQTKPTPIPIRRG